jgi:UDP:flavonoid glycosyltransferase YjiC (YdhE family)
MKYIIPTIGTRGDVQPYIALASRLQEVGHQAVIATHPCMRGLVEAYGVPFAPIGPDIDIGHQAAVIRAHAPHWMIGLMRVMRFTFAMLEQSHADLLTLCRQVDVVIVSHTAAGSMEADQLSLPKISVTLFPQAIPVRDPAEPLLKRTIGALAGWGMGLVMSRPLDRIRRRAGLPPMGPEGITSKTLNLVPISPHVYPPDPHWEPRHRMTGYWFVGAPPAWAPPDGLLAFLDTGDPPVVVSLGAMALGGADMLAAARLTLEALQQVGARAIIQGWDEAFASLTLPPTVYHAGSLPHTWLLPQASCVVHHGGFGTTAASFRAGIPAVIIPHIIDQFMWGQCVFELGVGPEPIPRPRLTASHLAEALEQVLYNQALRAKAAELGCLIRAETGAQTAVRLIEEARL